MNKEFTDKDVEDYGAFNTVNLIVKMIETGRDKTLSNKKITPIEAYIVDEFAAKMLKEIKEAIGLKQ
jgi:hypothetical protein